MTDVSVRRHVIVKLHFAAVPAACFVFLVWTHVAVAETVDHRTGWATSGGAEFEYHAHDDLSVVSAALAVLAIDRSQGQTDEITIDAPADVGADRVMALDVAVDEESAASPDEIEMAAWQLLNPPYTAATPLPASGKAMYYNPGVMKTVIESRTRFDHIQPCVDCIGFVAMLRRGDLDRRVWLQVDRWRVEGPFHVVDVAATKHVGYLLERAWIVDVDYRTAQRWGFRMPWVTVWEHPPLELLLATDTIPLEWDRCTAPAQAFTRIPHSASVAETALTTPDERLKAVIDRRQLGTGDFVEAFTDIPRVLAVK